MAIKINKPFQRSSDISPDTINSKNFTGESVGTGILGVGGNYEEAGEGDYEFVLAHGSRLRTVKINIDADNAIDWTKIAKIIDFLNDMSEGKVIYVNKNTYRHVNFENFDTLPEAVVDNQKAYIPFKVYMSDGSVPFKYPVTVPWIKSTLSDEAILVAAAAIAEELGYNMSGHEGVREVAMPTTVSKYKLG